MSGVAKAGKRVRHAVIFGSGCDERRVSVAIGVGIVARITGVAANASCVLFNGAETHWGVGEASALEGALISPAIARPAAAMTDRELAIEAAPITLNYLRIVIY